MVQGSFKAYKPFANHDQDVKPQSGNSRILQSPNSGPNPITTGGGIPYRPSLLEAGFTQNLTWVSEIIDLLFKLIAIVYFCTIFGIIPHKGYSQGHLKLRKYDIGKIQNGPQYPYRTSKKTFLGFCTHVPNNSEFLLYLPIC